jgi:coenzyme A diphosphatase NUDT7
MTYTKSCQTVNSKDKPTSRIAAVLVLLFEREGHLRVLLTTRAKRLVHGGETCLPGGHMEDADRRDIEITAVRPSSPSLTLTHSLRRGI